MCSAHTNAPFSPGPKTMCPMTLPLCGSARVFFITSQLLWVGNSNYFIQLFFHCTMWHATSVPAGSFFWNFTTIPGGNNSYGLHFNNAFSDREESRSWSFHILSGLSERGKIYDNFNNRKLGSKSQSDSDRSTRATRRPSERAVCEFRLFSTQCILLYKCFSVYGE